MAVFFSFHYDRDNWRVQQVINMGVVEGQPILSGQDWERVKRRGDTAIEKWIDDNMRYKRAVVVLVGLQTANRRWVRHEIIKAWNERYPLVGIRINGLKNRSQRTDEPGQNPFGPIRLPSGESIADYVPLFEPTGRNSQEIYACIDRNLQGWVNSAYRRS